LAPAAWRPVALLNTLGKVLETVMVSKIIALSQGLRGGRRLTFHTKILVPILTE
jgi:hypothetical protein